MEQFTLDEDLSLQFALKRFFPTSSGRTIQNWIKHGRILVDSVPVLKSHQIIQKGATLSLRDKPAQKVMGIPILYQDRWMIVIEKPAGLLSVPAEKPEQNAFHILKQGLKTSSIFPVHRLDQQASGVLMFARSEQAEEAFNLLFEKHDLEREYLAIVEGNLTQNEGRWESYIREASNYNMEVTSQELGKHAVTHFEVVRRSKKFTYLRLRLETGRKHQIRLHTSEAGHPILGDKRYGSLLNPFHRLCLHAQRLSFIHPFTKKQMHFTSQSLHTQKGLATFYPSPA